MSSQNPSTSSNEPTVVSQIIDMQSLQKAFESKNKTSSETKQQEIQSATTQPSKSKPKISQQTTQKQHKPNKFNFKRFTGSSDNAKFATKYKANIKQPPKIAEPTTLIHSSNNIKVEGLKNWKPQALFPFEENLADCQENFGRGGGGGRNYHHHHNHYHGKGDSLIKGKFQSSGQKTSNKYEGKGGSAGQMFRGMRGGNRNVGSRTSGKNENQFGNEGKQLSRSNMLREGQRPPVDMKYNNNNNRNKNYQNENQIYDQEDEEEQPEWADFTSEEIKVGERNQNKWGLTMSQDRDTILGIKKKQDDQFVKTKESSPQSKFQQFEVSMDQISTRELNNVKDSPPPAKPEQKHQQPQDLSKIQEEESKLGVTSQSVSFVNNSNNTQNIQMQQKVVDKTLKQKKQIDEKLEGVFQQSQPSQQNYYPQYPNSASANQYAYSQTMPPTTPNSNNMYYDSFNQPNNLYYNTNPTSSPSPSTSPMNPNIAQQQPNYYMNPQNMMYNNTQQQQQQQQSYQYQQYMQYNNNTTNNMPWGGLDSQQQYQQQNNPFACPRMNLLESARVWQYVDPQGNKQGKFTGTQMNDWLLAGYFTMDLKISCDGYTYMKLGQYLGNVGQYQTVNQQPQMQQSNSYYYSMN